MSRISGNFTTNEEMQEITSLVSAEESPAVLATINSPLFRKTLEEYANSVWAKIFHRRRTWTKEVREVLHMQLVSNNQLITELAKRINRSEKYYNPNGLLQKKCLTIGINLEKEIKKLARVFEIDVESNILEY